MSNFKATIHAEGPDPAVWKFVGSMQLPGKGTYDSSMIRLKAMTNISLLLRRTPSFEHQPVHAPWLYSEKYRVGRWSSGLYWPRNQIDEKHDVCNQSLETIKLLIQVLQENQSKAKCVR